MRCVRLNEIQFINAKRNSAAELSNGLKNKFKVTAYIGVCVSMHVCISLCILDVYTIRTHTRTQYE